MALFRVGHAHQDRRVGLGTVGDPVLDAVDDPTVAVGFARHRFLSGRVGAGLGLGLSMKHPSFSPDASGVSQVFFCSSLPNFRSGSQTSELFTLMMTPVDAQAAEISSIAST